MVENIESIETIMPEINICDEILTTFDENDIPISARVTECLKGEREQAYKRYGNGYTEASRTILTNTTNKEIGSLERLEVFGLNVNVAWEEISDLIDSEMPGLTLMEKEPLITEELKTFKENPTLFFEGLQNLDDLSKSEEQSESSKILFRSLYDTLHPYEKKDLPEFEFNKGTTWTICKDSEFYLTAAINSEMRYNNGARVNIYSDSEGPVFLQKKGRYKTEISKNNEGRVLSNATAITLREVVVNGIRLPAGTLVGLEVTPEIEQNLTTTIDGVHDTKDIIGVLPLRHTLFALPKEESEQAFGSHFQDFEEKSESYNFEGWKTEEPYIERFRTFAQKVVDSGSK